MLLNNGVGFLKEFSLEKLYIPLKGMVLAPSFRWSGVVLMMQANLSTKDKLVMLLNGNVSSPKDNDSTKNCGIKSKSVICPTCKTYHRCAECVETCSCGQILV